MAGGLVPIEVPGVLNVGYNQVVVGNSATLIVPARSGRRSVLIVNHGTTDIYIGDAAVLTTTGLQLTGTKGANLSIPGGFDIYGIVASGTQTVSYLEIY